MDTHTEANKSKNNVKLVYQPNSKHKEPWQPGRKGTLCPHEKGLCPSKLLKDSIQIEKKRYAVFNGMAFAAQMHEKKDRTEFWHGYPEAWMNVPNSIRHQWLKEKKVKRRDIKKFWKIEELGDF